MENKKVVIATESFETQLVKFLQVSTLLWLSTLTLVLWASLSVLLVLPSQSCFLYRGNGSNEISAE